MVDENQHGTIFEVWAKYEDIAMHFNGLIMNLRVQALGGVAAVSTLAGVFGKRGTTDTINWDLLSGVFAFLCLFWIAIWILDFLYYTRLLIGAVDGLLDLERLSATQSKVPRLNLSSLIEASVGGYSTESLLITPERKHTDSKRTRRLNLGKGRWMFYGLVFLGLFSALIVSLLKA